MNLPYVPGPTGVTDGLSNSSSVIVANSASRALVTAR